jgi:hypothetical protein
MLVMVLMPNLNESAKEYVAKDETSIIVAMIFFIRDNLEISTLIQTTYG